MKVTVTPAARMTLGVLCITMVLILLADMLGVAPGSERDVLAQRQRYVELVALQLSLAAEKINTNAMQAILLASARQNDDVIAAAIRRRDGVITAQHGSADKHWDATRRFNSATQMKMPLMRGGTYFADLEVVFRPLGREQLFGVSLGTMSALLGFVGVIGGLLYWLLIRRSLVYLDPNAVVPGRVRSALDVLANGVLILDEKGRIVLANQVFGRRIGVASEKLIGSRPADLPWNSASHIADEQTIDAPIDDRDGLPADERDTSQAAPVEGCAVTPLPWIESMKHGVEQRGAMLSICDAQDVEHVFSVNSSPIVDEKGHRRGVMVSFDDVTELQATNSELRAAIRELNLSRKQIETKNAELQFLATRDPLTGCFNRRAFGQKFEEAFALARAAHTALACIMTDIDHFKSVNDNHGHAAGDDVIRMVSGVLRATLPEGGVVGRYGGEEFCILLPGLGIFEAKKFAELCRQKIAQTRCADINVTSSFGVSGITRGASKYDEIISQADEALYVSKKSGRNCVSVWTTKTDPSKMEKR